MLETTLSGRAYAAKVQHWRALGCQVSLFFLRLPTAEMAIERGTIGVRFELKIKIIRQFRRWAWLWHSRRPTR